MAAPAKLSYGDILKSVQKGKDLAPVYLIHGEEGYFIDKLVEAFEVVIPEAERDFNLYTLYGPEVDAGTIISTCLKFPFMADYQVVIVKETQSARADILAKLKSYAEAPSHSSVLVLCFHSSEEQARRPSAAMKELIAAVGKGGGVVFNSAKIKEWNIDPVITKIVNDKGLNIEPKGLAMLHEYIGTNIAKIYNEIEKMAMILGPGATITPESIERNIGISKDYNTYELVDAIAKRDVRKAYDIIAYFKSNPKSTSFPQILGAIFTFFSNLLIVHFTPNKSPSVLMGVLGFKSQVQLRNYEFGARNYNAYKVIEIISAIRRCDAQIKGIGSRRPESELIYDLVSQIFNARGVITLP